MRRKAPRPAARPAGKPEPDSGPKWTLAETLCLGLVVAVFSWICFRNILQPGYYGDEAWQAVEAARFVWGRDAVHPVYLYRFEIAGHVLPKMLNTYIGPVEAYLLAVPFSIFGVSVPVHRATTGAVGLLGVVALYFLARREFGRLAAGAGALLLASDLSLALAMRCDWGPADFAFLARVASILLLLAWRRNRGRWLLFAGSLLLGLGLSFKFDFLGTIAAVAVAGLVCYGKGLRVRAGEAALAVGGFLLGAWPIILYNAMTGFNTLRAGAEMSRAVAHEPIATAVVHRLRTLGDLLNGGVGQFMLGENFRKSSLFGGSLLPAALFALPFLLVVPLTARSLAPWRRPLAFVVAVSAILLLAIAAVPMATGPHHVLSLYPFPHLLLGVALAALWHAGGHAPRGLLWPMRLAAAGGFLVLFVSNLALAETFHGRLAVRGGNRYWSESIYDLAAALPRDYPGDTAELLDWGFEQPLIILGKDRIPVRPLFWRIQGDPAPGWLADLLRQPHRVFVRRAPEFAFDPAVYERFDAALKRAADLTFEERKFFQKNGQLSFSILKFRPRP